MVESEWPSDWLRAVLPLVSLGVLSRGPSHGYALLQELGSLGFGSVKGGTIYPLLARQQELGHVEHSWETGPSGPARKVFQLTDEGRSEYERLARTWQRLSAIMQSTTASHTLDAEQK